MREANFHSLRETLLRGGIAPNHVRRTIAELRDHHTDLFAEAFARGCSVEDAGQEASMRLGNEDSLSAAILARRELKSWTHRWPWVAYWLAPTIMFVPAFLLLSLLLGLSGAVHVDHDTFVRRWGSPYSAWSLAGAIRLFYNVGLPFLLAGACCFVSGQRRAALRWPVIGVVIASIIGGAIQWDLFWPYGPQVRGAISIRIGVPPFPGSAGTLSRAATTCALTLGPFLWWKRKHHPVRRLP